MDAFTIPVILYRRLAVNKRLKMRSCPTCRRTYDDEKTFCMVEGTRLVEDVPPEEDPQPTMFAPGAPVMSPPAAERQAYTELFPADLSGGMTMPATQGYTPFSQPVEARKDSPGMLMKIVGGLLLLAVGLGLGYAVARFTSDKGPTASAQTDSAVLSELKEIEDKMTGASIKGDKTTLNGVLADDYSATGADGQFYNRTQTLYSTEPTPSVTSWSVDNARLLSRSETSATLSAVITFRSESSIERQQITDTFVKRDGRWRLLASQSTLLK
jgi:hypothetical protein